MPKIVDHDALRIDLLDRSFELFARRGYEGLTIRQIAEELELSTGSLYHYFDSKEAIFVQMLAHVSQTDVGLAVGSLPNDAGPIERIEILLDFIAMREKHFQNLLFIVLDYFRHPGADQNVMRQTIRYYRQAISINLRIDDEGRAATLLSLIIGHLLQRLLDPQFAFDRKSNFGKGIISQFAEARI
ncbi:MAG: TetR/AcrR family transcriptional regulator [Spirochaetia bacterium]|nr:TetR/AcrR family transcriptional regulator [Spirochaetia bacterium]